MESLSFWVKIRLFLKAETRKMGLLTLGLALASLAVGLIGLWLGLYSIPLAQKKPTHNQFEQDEPIKIQSIQDTPFVIERNVDYELGRMHDKGLDFSQNYTKAASYYAKAAEKGHAEAQNSLGNMYELGQGVEQDYEKAFELYSKAAEGGSGRRRGL